MPDSDNVKTSVGTAIKPGIDLEQQNKAVNDVLGVAVMVFGAVVVGLFLFRRFSRVGRTGGCAGCSSGSCPADGPDAGMSCHSARGGNFSRR